MSEKKKNRIFIAANCTLVVAIILSVVFGIAHTEKFLYFIQLLYVMLNTLNCIFIKDYRAIFACTIVYEILPVLILVLFGLDANSIGGQIYGMFTGVIMLAIAIWSVAVTVYKSIRNKGKY